MKDLNIYDFFIGESIDNSYYEIRNINDGNNEDVFDFINEYLYQGATTFLCTDIAKDGMLLGASRSLYQEIKATFNGIKLIASGGVHDMEEVRLLDEMQMESIIIGKAIYEGKIAIESLFEKP